MWVFLDSRGYQLIMSQDERVWQSEEEAEEHQQRVFAMERCYTPKRNAAALQAFNLYLKYVWTEDGQEIAKFLYETIIGNGYSLGIIVIGSKEKLEEQFKKNNPLAWPQDE
jgi:hypothetical protein